jgi:hypothetical protein
MEAHFWQGVPDTTEFFTRSEIGVLCGKQSLARCNICQIVLVEEAKVWQGK